MVDGLQVRDLVVGNRYTTILNGVSLDVPPGRSIGLVGPSGGGKTMLARSILGLLPESTQIIRGEIKLNKFNLRSLGESEYRRIRGRRIGYMVQSPSSALDPTATVRSQIASTLISHGIDANRKPVWKEVLYWLTRVGFRRPEEILKSYPFQLSGGMARRVYLAMLFILEPEFLIVDEPTSGLDVTTSRAIMQVLFGMQQRCTIVMITHDVRLLADRVDHLVVMDRGRIMDRGTLESLRRNPSSDVTAALLRPLDTEKPV